jgi:hypothetical protein
MSVATALELYLSVVNSRISRIARVYYIFGRKNEPFHDFSDP